MLFRSLKINFFFKVLLLLIIVSLMGLSTIFNYQRLVTFILMPFLAFLFFHQSKFDFSFFNNLSLKIYTLILILSLILLFGAIQMEVGVSNLIQLCGVLMGGIIVAEATRYNKELVLWILFCFVIGFYVSIYFMFLTLNPEIDITSNYIDRSAFDLNANKYSYYSFFANFALFFLIELNRKKIFMILSIITLLVAVYISFYTASRSGILINALAGVIYWLFIFKSKKFKVLRSFLVLAIIFYALHKTYDIFEGSYLQSRVDYSISEGDSRIYLAQDALNVFIEYPFFGVGPAQFAFYGNYHRGSYSHNSFLEAATNLGIIGFTLILLLFFKPIFNTLSISNKGLKKVSLMFFLFFILYNNFYVFYWSVVEMMFFFLITEIYYLDKRNSNLS